MTRPLASPTPKPGDLAAQATAEVDPCLIHALPGRRRPELQRVAMTPATMATVATARHVHRETATTAAGPAILQWTASVPLRSPPTPRLESQQVQHLLHRHDRANPLQIHSGHESSSLS